MNDQYWSIEARNAWRLSWIPIGNWIGRLLLAHWFLPKTIWRWKLAPASEWIKRNFDCLYQPSPSPLAMLESVKSTWNPLYQDLIARANFLGKLKKMMEVMVTISLLRTNNDLQCPEICEKASPKPGRPVSLCCRRIINTAHINVPVASSHSGMLRCCGSNCEETEEDCG